MSNAVVTESQRLAVSAVRADDHDGDNTPGNTVDGDLGTRWSAEGDGRWIEWDLGAPHDLVRVEIAFYKGDGRVATFDLEVATEEGAFTRVLDRQRSSGATTQLETFDLPAVSARFVRYVGHRNDGNEWNSLTEVEVWGTGSPGSGPHVVANVVRYPAIPSLTTSPVFRVFAGAPEQEIWTEQFAANRTIHIAAFAGTGSIPIRIQMKQSFTVAPISPHSRGIGHTIDGDSVRFTLAAPDKLIVFFTPPHGDPDDPVPLYLFADPPDDDPPPHAQIFAAGTHDVGDLRLHDGDTVHLAAGALVTGRLVADGATNITVRGRGILREPAGGGDSTTIRLQDCRNVLVEGITVRDVAKGWSTRYDRCDGVVIRDVKIFSCGINEDGVDPNGCTDFTIDHCLISAGDDCIAIKSLSPDPDKQPRGGRDVAGIRVLGTVLDSYPHGGGGDGVKIGTENQCRTMRDILVKDCDVVRAYGENDVGGHSAFSIVHKGAADISGVRYENVRVEGRIQHKNFEVVLKSSGTVSDVTLTEVAWEADKAINLDGAGIGVVTFAHCTVAGKPLTSGQVTRKHGAPAPTIV